MNTLERFARDRCTGPRYDGETLQLAASRDWHGKHGHFNTRELDHESACTGRGTHDRVLVTFPDHEGVYMRIDHVWSLGEPTERQLIALARKEVGLRGRWKLDPARTVRYLSNGKQWECTDCYLVPAAA